MQCPICRKPVTIDAPLLPFCSERCQEIDLGNWAMEKYVIPVEDVDPLRLSSDDED